jgi:hypothetical protein
MAADDESPRRAVQAATRATEALRAAQLTPSVTIADGKLTIWGKTPKLLIRTTAALVFLVVTVFGGFGSAKAAPRQVRPGTPIATGQFDITLRSASITLPDKDIAKFGGPQVIVTAVVHLTTDEALTAPNGALALSGVRTTTDGPDSAADARDGSSLVVNPDQTSTVTFGWTMPPGTAAATLPHSVTVVVHKMTHLASLPVSGYAGWVSGNAIATVSLPVRAGTGS